MCSSTSRCRPAAGSAIVGNSGGPGILAADACSSAGLTVPELSQATRTALTDLLGPHAGVRNPVDLLASADADAYEQALRLVLADDVVDAVIVIYTDPMISEPDAIVEAVRRAASATPHKTMLACFLAHDLPPAIELAADDGGDADDRVRRAVPVFPFPESPAVALGRIAELATWRRRPVGTIAVPDGYDGAAVREVVRDSLSTASGQSTPSIMDGARATARAPRRGRDLDGAAGRGRLRRRSRRRGHSLGLPVAMKVIAPDVLHKSDVGGVALGLATADAVTSAYDEMARRVPAMTGAVLQPMADPGVETIVGIVRDDLFGPVVMFGLGGTAAELFADRAFQIVPMTDVDAAELVRAPKSAPLLTGYRGSAPVDIDALEDLLLRIGTLAATVPELAELDLEPGDRDARWHRPGRRAMPHRGSAVADGVADAPDAFERPRLNAANEAAITDPRTGRWRPGTWRGVPVRRWCYRSPRRCPDRAVRRRSGWPRTRRRRGA